MKLLCARFRRYPSLDSLIIFSDILVIPVLASTCKSFCPAFFEPRANENVDLYLLLLWFTFYQTLQTWGDVEHNPLSISFFDLAPGFKSWGGNGDELQDGAQGVCQPHSIAITLTEALSKLCFWQVGPQFDFALETPEDDVQKTCWLESLRGGFERRTWRSSIWPPMSRLIFFMPSEESILRTMWSANGISTTRLTRSVYSISIHAAP